MYGICSQFHSGAATKTQSVDLAKKLKTEDQFIYLELSKSNSHGCISVNAFIFLSLGIYDCQWLVLTLTTRSHHQQCVGHSTCNKLGGTGRTEILTQIYVLVRM